jgi:hypothetical protein
MMKKIVGASIKYQEKKFTKKKLVTKVLKKQKKSEKPLTALTARAPKSKDQGKKYSQEIQMLKKINKKANHILSYLRKRLPKKYLRKVHRQKVAREKVLE